MIWQPGARVGTATDQRIDLRPAGLVTEAHVECRTAGAAWWHFAAPSLGGAEAADVARARRREGSRLDDLAGLFLGMGDAEDDLVGALGMPSDASAFTAERYALYRERRRRARQPELATWVDVRELSRVLATYEERAPAGRELVPATYCALLAMMQALSRDFDSRAVLWFDSPM